MMLLDPRPARSPRKSRGSALEDRVCSLSIGSSVAPLRRTASMNSCAADHQRLLVGQQQALAGARRRQRGRQPGGADDRRHHGVDLGRGRDLGQRGCALEHLGREAFGSDPRAQGAQRLPARSSPHNAADARGTARACARPGLAPVSANTSKRSGWRATTSSVLTPMEPVAPRMVRTRGFMPLAFIRSAPATSACPWRSAGWKSMRRCGRARRRGRAAGAAVLHAGDALDPATRTGRPARDTNSSADTITSQRPATARPASEAEARRQYSASASRDAAMPPNAFPGLARADRGRELVAAEAAAGEIGGGVGDPDQRQHATAARRGRAHHHADTAARPRSAATARRRPRRARRAVRRASARAATTARPAARMRRRPRSVRVWKAGQPAASRCGKASATTGSSTA